MALRALIVDDDESVRRLLETALPLGEADVEVVGTASDGQKTIEEVRRLRPDLVVLDHIMPNRTGRPSSPHISKPTPRWK
ncbi:MAG: response regulator transcription factor [Actinomycetota bacterium]